MKSISRVIEVSRCIMYDEFFSNSGHSLVLYEKLNSDFS